MFEKYITLLTKLFSKIGLPETTSANISELISFVTLLVAAFVVFLLIRLIVEKTLNNFIKKSPSKRDDILIKNKVFSKICLIIPAYIIRYFTAVAIRPGSSDFRL